MFNDLLKININRLSYNYLKRSLLSITYWKGTETIK